MSQEIITSQNQKPSQDWLSVVKTSKARHWIKKVLRDEQKAQTLQIGNEILVKYLKKYKLTPDSPKVIECLASFGFQDMNSLRISIGRGEFVVEKIGQKLFPVIDEKDKKPDNFFIKYLKRARSDTGIRVHGIDNMLLHFAKCCQPVPGDRIIGYLTKGKGITIHRTDCKNMIKLYEDKERVIDVEWDIDDQQTFQVHLSILGEERKNLLQDITQCISKQEINIISVYFSVEDMYAKGQVNIEVKDLRHLTKTMSSIRKLPGIFTVERVEDISKLNTST